MSPLTCIVECIRHGGWLAAKGSKIDLRKPREFPQCLVESLAANRDAVIELLTHDLIIVESKLDPGYPLIWCASQDVRDLLIEHGAEPGQIWTKEELRAIARASLTPHEIALLLNTKRLFDAELRPEPNTPPEGDLSAPHGETANDR